MSGQDSRSTSSWVILVSVVLVTACAEPQDPMAVLPVS